MRYPAGLNIQLSGLGIDACSIATLELLGQQGCPPNSVMGYGRAIAALPIKREVFHEPARITVVRTAERAGHQALLLYVYIQTGLSAQVIVPAEVFPASKPYGGLLDIQVPIVPTFPEGPDVTVTELQLVLGPKDLTYYEHVNHKLLRYKPAGIPLARHCPPGGFPFAIELSFLDGSKVAADTAVPCPPLRRPRWHG